MTKDTQIRIKPNRKPKGSPRQRDRTGPGGDESGPPRVQRIMPLGERERRLATPALALQQLEQGEEGSRSTGGQLSDDAGAFQRGVVMEVSTGLCRVDLDGRSLLCGLRGSLRAAQTGYTNQVAVGDDVLMSEDGSGRGVVEAVLPRRSALARPDVFLPHLQQVIVANAEQLLIVAAWRDPAIWLELIDRYLVTAERYRLSPIICVNKTDLAQGVDVCHQTLQPYLDLGYRVIFTSARNGDGIDALREVLRGRITVLAGLSGVGKSSLLAAVQPGLQLRIGAVTDYHIGRHVTAQVHMFKLDGGGFVVDTPGIREFGLSGLRRSELAAFYPEIAAAARGCRFRDCSHVREVGCAVKDAVQSGAVSASRYHGYKRIYSSLPDG